MLAAGTGGRWRAWETWERGNCVRIQQLASLCLSLPRACMYLVRSGESNSSFFGIPVAGCDVILDGIQLVRTGDGLCVRLGQPRWGGGYVGAEVEHDRESSGPFQIRASWPSAKRVAVRMAVCSARTSTPGGSDVVTSRPLPIASHVRRRHTHTHTYTHTRLIYLCTLSTYLCIYDGCM